MEALGLPLRLASLLFPPSVTTTAFLLTSYQIRKKCVLPRFYHHPLLLLEVCMQSSPISYRVQLVLCSPTLQVHRLPCCSGTRGSTSPLHLELLILTAIHLRWVHKKLWSLFHDSSYSFMLPVWQRMHINSWHHRCEDSFDTIVWESWLSSLHSGLQYSCLSLYKDQRSHFGNLRQLSRCCCSYGRGGIGCSGCPEWCATLLPSCPTTFI